MNHEDNTGARSGFTLLKNSALGLPGTTSKADALRDAADISGGRSLKKSQQSAEVKNAAKRASEAFAADDCLASVAAATQGLQPTLVSFEGFARERSAFLAQLVDNHRNACGGS